MLVLEGLVGLHRTIQGIVLDYCDKNGLPVIFAIASSTAFRTFLLTMMAKGFLPTVVDTMVI